jgi:hypothetical protein
MGCLPSTGSGPAGCGARAGTAVTPLLIVKLTGNTPVPSFPSAPSPPAQAGKSTRQGPE